MANDQTLIDRLRGMAPVDAVEKTVFGARCWVLDGHMSFGVHEDTLLVRLGPEAHGEPLKGFDPVGLGRPMPGWFLIDQDHLGQDKHLRQWMERAIEFTLGLPSK